MTRKRFSALTSVFLIGIGCMQMAGDLLGLAKLKAAGAATLASPAPKVFTAQDGFETYANRFFLEWHDAGGDRRTMELTPDSYAAITGPYNRRNMYGAVFSYAPVLERNPLTSPMFHAVLNNTFCGKSTVLGELGVPVDAPVHGPLRIRLEPRRGPVTHDFTLLYEVSCNG